MTTATPRFEARIVTSPGATRVIVSGDIDIATVLAFEAAIRQARAASNEIVLDMRAVDSADSTLARVLLRNGSITIDHPARIVMRVLQATGTIASATIPCTRTQPGSCTRCGAPAAHTLCNTCRLDLVRQVASDRASRAGQNGQDPVTAQIAADTPRMEKLAG